MKRATLFGLVVALLIQISLASWTILVPASEVNCFQETASIKAPILLQFQVIQGGALDIDLEVFSPAGLSVYSSQRQTEGRYSFTAEEVGDYKLCFSNSFSTLTDKDISFDFQVSHGPEIGPPTEENLLKKEHLTNLELEVNGLNEGLTGLINEQTYMKMREMVHRNTNESTNERVVGWSVFELIVVLFMSGFQIYYLRRSFEVRRIV